MKSNLFRWLVGGAIVLTIFLAGFTTGCSVVSQESGDQVARQQLEQAIHACVDHGGTPKLVLHYSETLYSIEDCMYPSRLVLGGR